MTAPAEGWPAYFSSRGAADVRVLGAGAEGEVYDLGDGRVAKVWTDENGRKLQALAEAYAALAEAGLPFATPCILDVTRVADRWVTYERRLPGIPLVVDMPGQAPAASPEHFSCIVEVLDGLRAVVPSAAIRELPVLGAPAASGVPFPTALRQLVKRRVGQGAPLLRQVMGDAEEVTAAVLESLAAVPRSEESLVHGDLIPGNILVDDRLRPLAVLDFGFFTTAGDPAFDAAVTTSIYDMFSPAAASVERNLERAVRQRFGYPAPRLAVYRAAYALATATVYATTADDGHLRWCAALLRRPDVRAALQL